MQPASASRPPTETSHLLPSKPADVECNTEHSNSSNGGYDSLEGSMQRSMRNFRDSVRRVRDIVVKHTGATMSQVPMSDLFVSHMPY